MNQIKINLDFGGALLPIVKNEAGQDIVPLKPICDVIGLKWESQRVKISDSYLTKRLGICTTCTPPRGGAGQVREMVCIRLDRVGAFLYTVNPNQVRVNGNEAAADYLERKHAEWDDLIHQYESQNGQLIQRVASAKIISIKTFLAVGREKRATADVRDRRVLEAIARDLAADIGAPYQPDLLDAAAK